MEDTLIHFNMKDIKQIYKTVKTEEPEHTERPYYGFEQMSPNGEYLVTFYMDKDGEIELKVRSPRGSYATLEKYNYEQIATVINNGDSKLN